MSLECLRDCSAECCKKHPDFNVIFYFDEKERKMFEDQGVALTQTEDGGYIMPGDCVYLIGNLCALHDTPEQPKVCVENKAGHDLCLAVRRAASGRRFNEVE